MRNGLQEKGLRSIGPLLDKIMMMFLKSTVPYEMPDRLTTTINVIKILPFEY